MFRRLKRPLEEYNKIWLGIVGLIVIAALVGTIVLIGRLSLDQTRYRGEFIQAAQLRAGDQVTVAGIKVGNVDNLTLAGDRVIVTFHVGNNVALGRNTRAAIKVTTLLGSRYLELSPAGTGTLENRTLRLANTSVPYDLQKALANATTTFEQVDADRIVQSMAIMSHSLTGVPEALPQALANLRSLSAIVGGRRDQIGTLLRSTDTLMAMLRNQKADLGSLVRDGRELLGELAARRAAVERLFSSVTALVNRMKEILDDKPAINDMLASVRDFARMIAAHDALLRNILQALPIPIRNFANVFGSGPALDLSFATPIPDSWMCALSVRSKQFGFAQYFQDCQ